MSRGSTHPIITSVITSLAISALMLAGKGWFAEHAKDLATKVEEQELAITKIDATYADVLRRLDRMEGKIDELISRRGR